MLVQEYKINWITLTAPIPTTLQMKRNMPPVSKVKKICVLLTPCHYYVASWASIKGVDANFMEDAGDNVSKNEMAIDETEQIGQVYLHLN